MASIPAAQGAAPGTSSSLSGVVAATVQCGGYRARCASPGRFDAALPRCFRPRCQTMVSNWELLVGNGRRGRRRAYRALPFMPQVSILASRLAITQVGVDLVTPLRGVTQWCRAPRGLPARPGAQSAQISVTPQSGVTRAPAVTMVPTGASLSSSPNGPTAEIRGPCARRVRRALLRCLARCGRRCAMGARRAPDIDAGRWTAALVQGDRVRRQSSGSPPVPATGRVPTSRSRCCPWRCTQRWHRGRTAR